MRRALRGDGQAKAFLARRAQGDRKSGRPSENAVAPGLSGVRGKNDAGRRSSIWKKSDTRAGISQIFSKSHAEAVRIGPQAFTVGLSGPRAMDRHIEPKRGEKNADFAIGGRRANRR